ncbi:hypothetical protein HYG86_05445 [Alkalicella caledoniensis]|uniref:Uncharacterized protein n=1 Tax=Alkalicella caledoniensis TaxID=2731377 RepID=A0A7G9W6E2_ALKCA|nr:hypothetical protein [Alkalicella caledoniensis]QNO14254.1 hypothetical protein HYG86_05445 [Alkalicella caledoniensis]
MFELLKKSKLILAFLALIIIGGYVFFQSSNVMNTKRLLGVNIPRDSTIIIKESSTGFFGDGEYYVEVLLSDKGLEKFINAVNKGGKWLPVPLSEEISVLIYGGKYRGANYSIGNQSKNIPQDIDNGVYYFRDRFGERNPEMKDTNVVTRGAYNITFAILDIQTKKLYIYELNT